MFGILHEQVGDFVFQNHLPQSPTLGDDNPPEMGILKSEIIETRSWTRDAVYDRWARV